jgi:hypothetical protein
MFDVDLYPRASSRVWHQIWYGHRSMRGSINSGDVVLSGEKALVAQFADWFWLSRFAGDVAATRVAGSAPLAVQVSARSRRTGSWPTAAC